MLYAFDLKLTENDLNGYSPLHLAVALRQVDEVKALLKSGADRNARDNKGLKPIDYASGHPEICRLLSQVSLEEYRARARAGR